MTITPVLLCGGSGTRLWPLSRKSFPKQFVPLMGSQTLFQDSIRRLQPFAKPLVITGSDFRFIVVEQLAELGIDPDAVLIEPEARNTAPAVLAAALYLNAKDPETLMLVCPSDHLIPDNDAFRHTVDQGVPAAEQGSIVTFGIHPTYPETGYGYLELAEPSDGGPVPLRRFVEKPDAGTAEQLLASGTHMWNAGIFLFKVSTIIEAFKTHCPAMITPVQKSVEGAQIDLGFLRLAPAPWKDAESISIDYAVMEPSDNLSVVPFNGAWSDLGGWDAIWRESVRDADGVALSGNATSIECTNSLLRSDSEGVELVGIGLDNIIAVAMNDAVLVADARRAQDVKRAVQVLKQRGAPQAESFPKDHRPWGWFESLAVGNRFQVKRIVVRPGAALSLQSHQHRSEHWIVVEGTAQVTINDEVKLVTENQSVYIPLGAVHRMENKGKVPMVLIEVQTGAYLGEDDIVRYDDVYARGQGAKG
ncbi:mannose-1-phosphate guanylyltransferase/mannose-6-phosphate isomerase [Sulfitobacter guttiformis]|uniref:mannose-1-phosphate guanylyltransferase n=1 Tax=Sulfitobacter guttiformis TaxID=74349 RepID=J7FY04_9RHOB|nr:mannose-1-phosphate guanylyltransferase/mannose-6-phosphate isomerase [Sulfitobacter guttiformis]AFP55475.1 mannose-1-phosphate guanylyltransferase (GDP) [Sulfitobacter guttiformis]KIN75511.1 Mannose-1-phosphate guanylyltransferase (GDP) [Sulfitobacter guttiformis KCTC 32187]RKE92097.1 mannose-1-phosphate guanylyltransferase (GDP) /mannose-6-phosphate isomerase type 2 [Sulfitobacter guttiformis]